MLGGALGGVRRSFPALMTKGSLLGHGALRMHTCLYGRLSRWSWGWQRGGCSSGVARHRPVMAGYLVGVGIAAGLMLAAGYWGGEMMITR